jgi:hypothetical protein
MFERLLRSISMMIITLAFAGAFGGGFLCAGVLARRIWLNAIPRKYTAQTKVRSSLAAPILQAIYRYRAAVRHHDVSTWRRFMALR